MSKKISDHLVILRKAWKPQSGKEIKTREKLRNLRQFPKNPYLYF